MLGAFETIFCYTDISLFAISSPASPRDIKTNTPASLLLKMSAIVGFSMIMQSAGVKEDLAEVSLIRKYVKKAKINQDEKKKYRKQLSSFDFCSVTTKVSSIKKFSIEKWVFINANISLFCSGVF